MSGKNRKPTPETIDKMRRVKRLVENDWPTKLACKEVGIHYSSFYMYRKSVALEKVPS